MWEFHEIFMKIHLGEGEHTHKKLEKPIKIHDLGAPLFLETPKYIILVFVYIYI